MNEEPDPTPLSFHGSRRIYVAVSGIQAHFRRILFGCRRYLDEHGLDWLLMDRWDSRADREVTRAADGVIVQGPLEAVWREAMERGVPIVQVSGASVPGGGYATVISDNRAIGRRAAEHFLSRGFRDFAFTGVASSYYSVERLAGFEEELARCGMGLTVWDVGSSAGGLLPEYREWLAGLPTGCGIFCANDIFARSTVRGLASMGRRVPEDVALMGADDDELESALSPVPLTSVETLGQAIGMAAMGELNRQMLGDRPCGDELRVVLVPPGEVVVRASNDIYRVEDAVLARALRLIRDGAGDPEFRPEMVVRDCGVSRRTLERRFRGRFGRGIEVEIRRARIENARRLLVTTRLPVGAVAERSGFRDIYHFSRVFKEMVGMSPNVWRRMTHG